MCVKNTSKKYWIQCGAVMCRAEFIYKKCRTCHGRRYMLVVCCCCCYYFVFHFFRVGDDWMDGDEQYTTHTHKIKFIFRRYSGWKLLTENFSWMSNFSNEWISKNDVLKDRMAIHGTMLLSVYISWMNNNNCSSYQ